MRPHAPASLAFAMASLAIAAVGSCGQAEESLAQAELDQLSRRVTAFRIIPLPAGGAVKLLASDSFTIEDLRGVPLEDDPPHLAGPIPRYDRSMADDCPADERPYVARDIQPFRFRHFHCEFNYGGWHNYDMQDYAATHGFDILYPYMRRRSQVRHWPEGTKLLQAGGFIDWDKWLPDHRIPAGRYDLLAGMDLLRMHMDAGLLRREPNVLEDRPRCDLLMIDMEHSVLPPESLHQQPWFPKDAPEQARADFERKYYDGYAQTYISAVAAAKKQGWPTASVYGWEPYGRTWFGLEKSGVENGAQHAWNAFGRQICDAVDVINNSVYCFYWSPRNLAYVLANIDANVAVLAASGKPKPVRPYFWTLLHGGGGGWRWWREQPLASEEMRAITAMAFFTGIDGIDCWNWSGTLSHHTPSLSHKEKGVTVCDDVMIGREFAVRAEDGAEESLRRYDVLHVLGIDEKNTVRLQKIRPGAKNDGADAQFPVFTAPRDMLLGQLRPKSQPVAAMIEGLALVKPFEHILRHGQVKIDVPARAVRRDSTGGPAREAWRCTCLSPATRQSCTARRRERLSCATSTASAGARCTWRPMRRRAFTSSRRGSIVPVPPVPSLAVCHRFRQ